MERRMGFVRCGLLAMLALVVVLVGAVPVLAAPGGIPGASSLSAKGATVQASLPAYVLDSVTNASQVAKLARLAGGRATLLYAPDADPATLSAMLPEAGVTCDGYIAPEWQRGVVSYALLLPDGGVKIGALTLSEVLGKAASLDALTPLLNDAAPAMLAEAVDATVTPPWYKYVQSSGRFWVDTSYGRLAFWFSGKMIWNDGSDTKDYWLSHWYQETYPKTGVRTVRVDTAYALDAKDSSRQLAAGELKMMPEDASVAVTLGYAEYTLPPLAWTYGFVGDVIQTSSPTVVTWKHIFAQSWSGSIATGDPAVPSAVCQPGFNEVVPQNASFVANLSGSVGWIGRKAVTVQLPKYRFNMVKPTI